MDVGRTLAISAAGLRAERVRLDVVASNLANANTTRTPAGGPYQRRQVVFRTFPLQGGIGEPLRAVRVDGVVVDPRPPRRVFDPGHPDADGDGYVAMPNVDVVSEMVDLMMATRAYEANVAVVNATKRLAESALGIGGR